MAMKGHIQTTMGTTMSLLKILVRKVSERLSGTSYCLYKSHSQI